MSKKQRYYNQNGSISPEKLQEVLETGGKLPPQAPDIENAVLGSMLMSRDEIPIALEQLSGEDFYKPANRYVFEAIGELNDANKPVDTLTVENTLKRKELLETIGGIGYLTNLSNDGLTGHTEYYCQIIREKSLLRQLILNNTEITSKAYEPDADAFEVIEANEQKQFELTGKSVRGEKATDFKTGLVETIDHIVELRDMPVAGITGITSGLSGLDNYTGGWQKGDFYIIAGRPAMGKTGAMLSFVRNAAAEINEYHKAGSAVFSLEMSKKQLNSRVIAMQTNIELSDILRGRVNDEEFGKIVSEADEYMKDYNIIVDDKAQTFREIRSRTREYIQRFGIGIVFIDYMQLMDGMGDEGNREQEISKISRGLKKMAKEFNIPVVALSQLSRKVEDTQFKRPQLSHLRESGQIEQDADVVIFVWRPQYYEIHTYNNRNTDNLAYLIIAKQRNGPTGDVICQFNKETTEFRNLQNWG